jgi:predicted nucleic acid-binding protein
MSPAHFPPRLSPLGTASAPSSLVLDTNIVLDWLLFADPLVELLTHAVTATGLALITHLPALEELQRVLGYDAFKLEPVRQAWLLEQYRRHTCHRELPPEFAMDNLLLPTDFPLCKDPDDQHFLALCYHTGADALVTRDKAVLALRKRARKFGVTIIDIRQLAALLYERDQSLRTAPI